MAKPKNRKSIIIPDHLHDVIDTMDFESECPLTVRIASILDRYRRIVRDVPPLTYAEWVIILDATSGWMTKDLPADELIGGIAEEIAKYREPGDAPEPSGFDDDDTANLLARLDGMTPGEQIAIVEMIERFGRREPKHDTMGSAMRDAGIEPSDGILEDAN